MRKLCAVILFLVLAGGLAVAPPVHAAITGFGDGTGWTTNDNGTTGVPNFDVFDTLQLTSMANDQATSAFYDTVQGVEIFSAEFDYQYLGSTGAPADGIAFVVQNNANGVNALGASGGGLGYSGITTSAALLLSIYENWEVGIQVAADGVVNGADHVSSSPVDLLSGNPIRTRVDYNGVTATVTLEDMVTHDVYEESLDADVPGYVGGPTAFVGFTGGTGGLNADQRVSNFSYTSSALQTLYWDKNGNNAWGSTHWTSTPPGTGEGPPDAATHAILESDNTNTVTVGAAGGEAFTLAVDGGGIDITGGATLSVTGAATFAQGTTLTMGNGATLASRGGSIPSVAAPGTATFNTGSTLVVTAYNGGGTPGSLIKQGDGALGMDNSNGTNVNLAQKNVVVEAGTLNLKGGGTNWSGGASDFTLDGGTLSVGYGLAPGAANGLTEWYFDGDFGDEQLDPIHFGSGFLTMSPDAQTTLDTNLNFDGSMMYTRSGGVIGDAPYERFGAMWVGYISIGGTSPLAAGDVSFGTDSDDGSVVWVDGQLVVDNNGLHGVGAPQTGNINLADGDHEIVIGMYEQDGGESIATRLAPGVVTDYNQMTGNLSPPLIPDYVNPSGGGQANLWKEATLAYPQVTGTNLTVSGPGSGIQVAAASTANLSVEMEDGGTLATLPGPAGGYDLSANVATGAQYVGFDPQAPTTYNINANNQNVAIAKVGQSTWVLDADPVTNAQNSTWQVDDGVFQLEGTDPLGGRGVKVVGGELLLGDTAAPLNGAPVELAGGMLTVAGELVEVLNVNWSFFAGGNSDANLSGIDDGAVNGQNGGLFGIPPTSTGVWTGPLDDPAGRGDNYAFMWHGTLNAQLDGVYTFFTQADDHEILWLDANRNGDFELSPPAPDVSEQITENLSTDPAGWNVEKTGTVTLAAGQSYDFAYAYYENTGGEFGWIDWTPPGGTRGRMTPTSLAGVDFTGANAIDWTVTADSTLNARTNETARFSAPLMKAGILTTVADTGGNIVLEGVNIDPTATRVGFDPQAPTDYGTIDANSAAVTIVKAGTSTWHLKDAPTEMENAVAWRIEEGTLRVVGDSTPLAGAPVILAGGTFHVEGARAAPDPPPNPVGQWNFDDGSADDSSGNGHHGTNNGGSFDDTDLPPDGTGRCLDLTGGDSWVDVDTGGTQDVFDLGGAMTIAAWVKGVPGGWWPYISKNGEENGWQMRRNGRAASGADGLDWTTRGVVCPNDPNIPGNANDNGDFEGISLAIHDGQWHHIAATYDGTTKRIYVDGMLDNETTVNSPGSLIRATDSMLVFGAARRAENADPNLQAAHRFLDGKLDEIFIYNTGLSAAQILALVGERPLDMNDVPLSVSETSTLRAGATSAVPFGHLTLINGLLTITGDAPAVSFDDTWIDPAATAVVGVDLQLDTDLGVLDGSNASATFTKSGPVDLVLWPGDTTQVENLTFAVAGGRLIGVATPEIKGSPFGTGDLQIDAGELVLASGQDRGSVAFESGLTVTGDGTLTVGSGGVGEDGPLTVTLGTDTGKNVALDNGTVTVRTEDRYKLRIAGSISGPGNMDLTAGEVTVEKTINVGDLNLVGGTLLAGDAITANNLNVFSALKLTGSGPQKNITINPGGSLNLLGSSLNLEGATLTAPEADLVIGFGRTLVYDQALTVGSLNLSGTLALRGMPEGSRDLTINPGGALTVNPDTFLNMTDLTSGTLTIAGSDIVVQGGELTAGNDFDVQNVTITSGSLSTTGHYATIHGYLQLGNNRFQTGGPFRVTFSNPEITLDGETLTVTDTRLAAPAGTLAHWTLDEDGGSVAADSADGYDGTVNGNPQWNPSGGMVDGAMAFLSTSGDHVSVPGGLPIINTSFSTSFWAKRDRIDDDAYVLGQGDNATTDQSLHVGFRRNPDRFTLAFYGDDLNWTDPSPDTEWHLWTTTFDADNNNRQSIYKDGVLVGGRDAAGMFQGSGSNDFWIGRRRDGTGNNFDGLVDDVWVFDHTLTQAEVDLLSAAPGFGWRHGPAEINQPDTSFRVTATSTLNMDTTVDAVFGNLTLQPGADLTVTGPPAVSFNDVTTGPAATITLLDEPPPALVRGGIFIRGVLSPGGNDPGLLTVDGVFELGDFAEYACNLADWNPDTNPDPWNENPPLVVNDKITFTGNLEAYLAGTLTLRATSKLRVVGQFEQQWYGDQTRTIMDTVGESTISDWGAFLDVPAPDTHLGHGVFATDQGANGQVVTQTFTTVKVDVFQAADGDGNGDRYLNSDDILAILGANTFGTGLPADWGTGDYNADGICNSDDIQAILATNLWDPFSNLPYAAAVEPGDPGDGVVELMVDPADGMLVISADDVTINSYVIKSAAGIFTGEAADNLGFFVEDTDTRVSGSFAFTLLGQHELGRVIGSEWEILAKDDVDLTFTYTVRGAGGTFEGNLIIIPEPGTVVMLLTGAVGLLLLALRRRSA